jgi:cell division protein FtsN
MQFESKTDTVDVTQTGRAESVAAAAHEAQIRFMVQIGAFKDPHNAVHVQTLARTRYRMPVLNDFDLKLGVYQIRIGFFETREAAMEFRARLQKEFLEDYRDAWVVQLRR